MTVLSEVVRLLDRLEHADLVRASIAVFFSVVIGSCVWYKIPIPDSVLALYAAIITFYFSSRRGQPNGE